MNNRFADLIPSLLFAATTFVVVAFCVHHRSPTVAGLKPTSVRSRCEPYRDTDAAEGPAWKCSSKPPSGLYGIGAPAPWSAAAS